MKGKIKKIFIFFKEAWLMGPRGKIGIGLVLLSLFFFVRLFYGEPNLQGFLKNIWVLHKERQEFTVTKNKVDQLDHHIYLLQHPNNSSDYIEELGLHTLNLGDSDFKELKY